MTRHGGIISRITFFFVEKNKLSKDGRLDHKLNSRDFIAHIGGRDGALVILDGWRVLIS